MEIIVTEYDKKRFYILYREGHAEYLETEYESGLGNIYAGKVVRVQKNIDAAFVQIGPAHTDTGFLPLKEIPPMAVLNRDFTQDPRLKCGDTVLVQLTADEEGDKKPRLKCTLSFSGRYTVVTLGRQGIGCSKQIPQARRGALLKDVRARLKNELDTGNFGVLIRTEASAVSVKTKDITLEAAQFSAMLYDACAYKGTVPALLYKRPHEEMVLEHLLSLLHVAQRLKLSQMQEDTTLPCETSFRVRVVTRNDALQKLVINSGFTYMHPEIPVLIAGNEADLTGRTDKTIAKCLSRKVYLNSGGILVFDRTEALCAIDVNTAHTALKQDPAAKEGRKTLAEKISAEACDEIMRQIRMRNLSGIILIDLPAMPKAASTRILKQLRALAEIDTVKTQVHDITALGIAELTRERTGKPLT